MDLTTLRRIGRDLDEDRPPDVCTDGLVMPALGTPFDTSAGDVKGGYNAELRRTAGSKRPAAGQGEGSSGYGSAAAAVAEALVLGQPGLSEVARRDLEAVRQAYPSLRLQVAAPFAWLLCPIRLLPSLADRALLLTRYPLTMTSPVASWAWWDTGIWIGPRHTNFPDGSLCSFEPAHKTWTVARPLWQLLDLHVGWIVRQLHLRYLGRWPGRQVAHTAYERVLEQMPGELCGCGTLSRYEDCCRTADLRLTAYERRMQFRREMALRGSSIHDLERAPPAEAIAALLRF